MEAAAGAKSFSKADAIFFAGVFLFAYLQLFRLPFTPIYFDGDALVPVSNAVRMVDGEAIYRDFFHFVVPGADLLYASLFYVFGPSVAAVNSVILILTLAQVVLLWFFGRRVLNGVPAFLPSLIFLVLGFRQFGIDGSQRLMSVVFAYGAVAVLAFSRTRANLALAGVFCSVASFFQQQRGAVIAFAIVVFLVWESYVDRRSISDLLIQVIVLAASCVAATVALNAYFVYSIGLGSYYDAIIGFAANNYSSDPFNNSSAYLSDLGAFVRTALESASPLSSAWRLVLVSGFYYLLVPYIYVAFLAYAWFAKLSTRRPEIFRLLLLLCLAGIFSAVGVSGPTITRVFHVAIPAIVIFVWMAVDLTPIRRLAPILTVALTVAAGLLCVQRQTTPAFALDMPAGRSSFLFEPTFAKYRWIGEHTEPGEIVYEPRHPDFYFPFHLKNPSPLNTIRDSGYTPRTQIDQVVRSLENSPPRLVVWPESWSKEQADRNINDNVGPLWDFVQKNYTPVYRFPPPDDPTRLASSDDIVFESRTDSPRK